jgi:hypothetical protein
LETLHRDASKLIRKGIRKQEAYDFLKQIKDRYPHWWLTGAFIVGIPRETSKHFKSVIDDIIHQKLLDAILVSPLSSKRYVENPKDQSEFFKHPEQYGLTLYDDGPFWDQTWSHDHMHSDQAKQIAEEITADNLSKGYTAICPWEWAGRKSWKNYSECANHIAEYKKRK